MGLGNCVFIGDVVGKIDDYRICKKCESINWYENKRCASDEGCDSTEFKQWSYKKYREWYDEEVEWAMITEYESGNEDIIELPNEDLMMLCRTCHRGRIPQYHTYEECSCHEKQSAKFHSNHLKQCSCSEFHDYDWSEMALYMVFL